MFLIFLSLVEPGHSQDKLTLRGRILDYEWTHFGNKLALLFIDPNDNHFLYIFDADRHYVTKKIFLDREGLSFHSLAWDSKDANIILSAYNDMEFSAHLFSWSPQKDKLEDYRGKFDFPFVYIFALETEPKKGYWAIGGSEEGHPHISVFSEGREILGINPYPGTVDLTGWRDGVLYVTSDMPLEYGLTMEERDTNLPGLYADPDIPRENSSLYEVDISTGKAVKSQRFYKDISNTSFQGKYYLTVEQKQEPEWFEVVII